MFRLSNSGQKFFYKQLKQAQAAVPEPSGGPKIKLKIGQTAESTPTPKKITIHVGGRESVDSPAPQPNQATDTPATTSQPVNGSTRTSTPAQPQVEKAGSASVAAPSPTPSVPGGLKAEESSVASPAAVPRPPSVSSGQATPGPGAIKPPIPTVQSQPFQHNPLANGYMEQKRLRGKGKGMCINTPFQDAPKLMHCRCR